MNNRLAEQISYLLLRHSYVVVPQLGGFIREALPASYQHEQHLAYPPSAELHFSQELQHSDGLLEARYALLLGISLRRARLILEEEVKQLRHILIQRGQYQLPLLGTLELTGAGKINFVPYSSSKLLQGISYGLSPLSLPLLQQEAAAGSSEPLTKAHEAPQAERPSRDYIQLRIPKRAAAYAASIIILILSLIPWQQSPVTEQYFQAGFTPTPEAAQSLWGHSSLAPQPKEEAPAAPADSGLRWGSSGDGRYYVIIATERSEERLLSYYEEARHQIEEPEAIVALRSRHSATLRLAAASFDDAAAAYNYLNRLVKAHRAYSSSWVFHNK